MKAKIPKMENNRKEIFLYLLLLANIKYMKIPIKNSPLINKEILKPVIVFITSIIGISKMHASIIFIFFNLSVIIKSPVNLLY